MTDWTPEALKNFRKTLGLTQESMAERLGVHKNYISMLEYGAKKPGKTLQLLLDCLEREHGKETHS